MSYLEKLGRAIIGGAIVFFGTLIFPLNTVLFIGSGDYTGLLTKLILILVCIVPLILLTLTNYLYYTGTAKLSEFWQNDTFNLMGMNFGLSLLGGVFINVVTGRGELSGFALAMAAAAVLGFSFGLAWKGKDIFFASLKRIMTKLRARTQLPVQQPQKQNVAQH